MAILLTPLNLQGGSFFRKGCLEIWPFRKKESLFRDRWAPSPGAPCVAQVSGDLHYRLNTH